MWFPYAVFVGDVLIFGISQFTVSCVAPLLKIPSTEKHVHHYRNGLDYTILEPKYELIDFCRRDLDSRIKILCV